MNKLQAGIMNMNFQKTAKRFIILSLIIVILGGVLTGLMFRTQIGEAITYHQTYENNTDNESRGDYGGNDRYYSENRGDHESGHDYENADFFESGLFTKPSVGAEIVFWVYAVLCALLALAYWLLIMAWLYQAAAKASMNRTLWTILGLFFNLVAVIAFLIVRSLQAVCPSCGVYQKAAEYCRVCGAPMKCKCAGCGTLVDVKDSYCSNCGRALKNENAEETK